MISDFAKEKVFWTRKMNLKLVKFIQSKPNIWNPKHPKYTSAELRDQTYAEFASKYGNEFTGNAVKHRWTNIRSTFANYLRKLEASRAKGEAEEYQINWPLWEPCQFLMKVNRRIKSEAYINGEDEKKDVMMSTSVDRENWSSEDIYTEDNFINESNSKCDILVDNLVNVFKGVQNDAFGLDNTTHGQIGRVIAKKLSRMNSYDAARISKKIMDILLLYDGNNPENPNNLL